MKNKIKGTIFFNTDLPLLNCGTKRKMRGFQQLSNELPLHENATSHYGLQAALQVKYLQNGGHNSQVNN